LEIYKSIYQIYIYLGYIYQIYICCGYIHQIYIYCGYIFANIYIKKMWKVNIFCDLIYLLSIYILSFGHILWLCARMIVSYNIYIDGEWKFTVDIWCKYKKIYPWLWNRGGFCQIDKPWTLLNVCDGIPTNFGFFHSLFLSAGSGFALVQCLFCLPARSELHKQFSNKQAITVI
jgi:hypothetical protein